MITIIPTNYDNYFDACTNPNVVLLLCDVIVGGFDNASFITGNLYQFDRLKKVSKKDKSEYNGMWKIKNN